MGSDTQGKPTSAGKGRAAAGPMSAMKLPRAPRFESLDQERRHRQERLAAGFRLFAKFGFEEGVAGHITARDPEHPDRFWVNPLGMPFAHISVSDLIQVNHDGEVLHGDRPVNQAAFVIHSHVHRARPDTIAAAHSHSLYGKTFSTLGRMLEPLTQDATAFYGDHALFDDYGGVVLEHEEGERIAQALGDNKAAILRNHGLLTVGATVDAALWWFITMERSCQSQLLAMAAGDPISIPHEQAEVTGSQTGSEGAGWFNFQPLYEKIVREQPDLLD